jgi:phosphoribosylformylglycinamidine (FGAM) synthase PurS component
MTKIKLLVGLKIPDTTAITAFHTLERMGYKELKGLERLDYYEFEVDGDADKFARDIVGVDILVNANKNTSLIMIEGVEEKEETTNILVKNSGDKCQGILSTLAGMGFNNIKSMSKGVLWKMDIDSREKAEEITKNLLSNEHYQEYKILN